MMVRDLCVVASSENDAVVAPQRRAPRADRRPTIARIRELLDQNELLPAPSLAISCNRNLYEAGLRSRGVVTLMLALEEAFAIEFPDRLLNRSSFETMRAIADVIADVKSGALVD